MLRVRTGQKALRAVGGRLFLNRGRAEKLTGWNTPPAVRKTKGLRNCREEQPHPRWRKEAGGGARGKLSPREATPSLLANRPRFLSKDFLRPDRRRRAGAAEGKGRVRKPLAARAARHREKSAQHPGRGRQDCWLPGKSTASDPRSQRFAHPAFSLCGPSARRCRSGLKMSLFFFCFVFLFF